MAWWNDTPVGERIPVAVVGIDGVGWTKERDELPPETIRLRKEEYYARIQQVTREFGGPDAAVAGDGGILFLHFSAPRIGEKPSPIESARHGFRAAMALWQAIRVDLNLQVRIAVHCASMPWDPNTGRLDDKQLDLWGHLDKDGGIPNAIVVSEDVFLALERPDRERLAFAGTTKRDRIPVYCFPIACASRADAKSVDPDPDQKLWDAFRAYVRTPEIAKLQYIGLRLRTVTPPTLDLETVFVPVDVDVPERESLNVEQLLGLEPRPRRPPIDAAIDDPDTRTPWAIEPFAATRTRQKPFTDVFKSGPIQVILGDPGAGKTTLAKWLALIAADGRLRMEQELGAAERRLPLPVSVGLLVKWREKDESLSVLGALGHYFQERSVGTKTDIESFLKDRFEKGEVLFLLDGLDEVATDRAGATSWLQAFVGQHHRNRFVITSRIVGFSGLPRFDSDAVVVRPFSDAQVERYVRVFCDAYREAELGQKDPRAGEIANNLLAAIRKNDRLNALARNPFLLSSIALIHRAEGALPRHRVQFYEIFLRALCETWAWARRLVTRSEGVTIDYETEAIPILGDLAYRMHLDHPTGVAPRDFVLATMARALQKRGVSESESEKSAREFLGRAGEQAQVLVERGPDRWGFLHLTFQEFLVAMYLLYEEEFEVRTLERRFDPRWAEILRLGVGAMVLIQKRGRMANELVRRVLDVPASPPREWLTDLLFRNLTAAAILGAELGTAIDPDLASKIGDSLWHKKDLWTRDLWHDLNASLVQDVAVRKTLDQLAASNTSKTKREVAKELEIIGSERGLETLLLFLRENDDVRQRAVFALASIGSENTVVRLVSLLGGGDVSCRKAAAQALGEVGTDRAVTPLIKQLSDADPEMRRSAVDALGRIGSPLAIDSVCRLLDDSDHVVRARAAMAAGSMGSELAIKPLIRLLQDESNSTLPRVARALERIGSRHVVDEVVPLLEHTRPMVRRMAARILGVAGSEEVFQPLVQRLTGDVDPDVRGNAALALRRIGHDAASRVLVTALNDHHPSVQRNVAYALGGAGNVAAVAPLIRLLRSRHSGVQQSVSHALGAIASGEAVRPLQDLTRDTKRPPEVRLAAARALGNIDPLRGVGALVQLSANEKRPRHRSSAIRALSRLADQIGWASPEVPA